jgi:hypothetical protein
VSQLHLPQFVCLSAQGEAHQKWSREQSNAGQDWRGRLHDVLWMTFLKLRPMQKNQEEEFPAEVSVIINGVMQTLWAVIEGDGLTIMHPADY